MFDIFLKGFEAPILSPGLKKEAEAARFDRRDFAVPARAYATSRGNTKKV
jgi:hypothetical protein